MKISRLDCCYWSWIIEQQQKSCNFLWSLFLHSGSSGEFNLDLWPAHHSANTALVLPEPSEHVTGLREEACTWSWTHKANCTQKWLEAESSEAAVLTSATLLTATHSTAKSLPVSAMSNIKRISFRILKVTENTLGNSAAATAQWNVAVEVGCFHADQIRNWKLQNTNVTQWTSTDEGTVADDVRRTKSDGRTSSWPSDCQHGAHSCQDHSTQQPRQQTSSLTL